MTFMKLTASPDRGHKMPMRGICANPAKGALLLLGASILAGCITVNAPDGPIVIELNINISQEVVYRLAEDVSNTIEENSDIF